MPLWVFLVLGTVLANVLGEPLAEPRLAGVSLSILETRFLSPAILET